MRLENGGNSSSSRMPTVAGHSPRVNAAGNVIVPMVPAARRLDLARRAMATGFDEQRGFGGDLASARSQLEAIPATAPEAQEASRLLQEIDARRTREREFLVRTAPRCEVRLRFDEPINITIAERGERPPRNARSGAMCGGSIAFNQRRQRLHFVVSPDVGDQRVVQMWAFSVELDLADLPRDTDLPLRDYTCRTGAGGACSAGKIQAFHTQAVSVDGRLVPVSAQAFGEGSPSTSGTLRISNSGDVWTMTLNGALGAQRGAGSLPLSGSVQFRASAVPRALPR